MDNDFNGNTVEGTIGELRQTLIQELLESAGKISDKTELETLAWIDALTEVRSMFIEHINKTIRM